MKTASRLDHQITTKTGVGSYLCSSHRDKTTGTLHGHTWDVVAWFNSSKNALELQFELNCALAAYDHVELPEELAWGEALAAKICSTLEDCVEVVISRPSERIYAKAIKASA